jgi:hypothetical protein
VEADFFNFTRNPPVILLPHCCENTILFKEFNPPTPWPKACLAFEEMSSEQKSHVWGGELKLEGDYKNM